MSYLIAAVGALAAVYFAVRFFLLKRSFLSIYSNAGQDFDDEEANESKSLATNTIHNYYRLNDKHTAKTGTAKTGE